MADLTLNLTFDAPFPSSVVLVSLHRIDDGQELTLSDTPVFTPDGSGGFVYSFVPPAPNLNYVYTYLATWPAGKTYRGRGYKEDARTPSAPGNVNLTIKTDPPAAISGNLLTLKRLDTGLLLTLSDPTLTLVGSTFSYSFLPPARNLKYSYTYRLIWADGTIYEGRGFKQDAQTSLIAAAPLDAALLAIVNSVLSGIGGRAILRFVPSFYDPLEGLTAEEAQQWEIPCSPPYSFRLSQINGTNIKAGDFQLIVPAKALADFGIVPDISMSVLRGALKYTIVEVTPLNSGNADVAFILQCRNA